MYQVIPNTYFAALDLRGSDASKTLQGQLTNDVERQPNGSGIRGLLCNIKGRVEVIIWVYKHSPEHLTLVVPTPNIDITKQRLAPYVAFSKSQLTELDLSQHNLIFALSQPDNGSFSNNLNFEGVALLPFERLPAGARTETLSSPDDFHRYRIENGMVQLTPQQSGLYTPQALSLDRLGYVSYQKGCYMGQEIIARLHYKGQSKYQLALLQSVPGLSYEQPIIDHTGATIGSIVDASANGTGEYLASIRTQANTQSKLYIQEKSAIVQRLF